MNRLFIIAVTIITLLPCSAQKIAIKSNLLYDVTTTMNLGLEFGLGQKWTIDMSGNYNPWTFSDNKKWKHWMIQPEGRYWLCDRFNGHFFGVHLLGGEHNIGNVDIPIDILGTNFKQLKDYRYEGWFAGGGISYGYSWMLGNRWNIEASLGIGYTRFDHDRYACEDCGEWQDKSTHDYIGITKAAINIIYVIK
jgi:hypothetical protein